MIRRTASQTCTARSDGTAPWYKGDMATTATRTAPEATRVEDQRIILHGVSWSQYEAILAIRGDRSAPRIAYLEGELEIMSPSVDHEGIKKTIARLVEAYAEELGLSFNGYGSWTVRNAPRARGVEPDECYVLGTHKPDVPDLAIEVIWTSGGLDKLEIYRGLSVREVWVWRHGRIQVHVLKGGRYVEAPRSQLLPELDLERLQSSLLKPDQTQAVRDYRHWLRREGRKRRRPSR